MKILHVNYHAGRGGAATAALRLHRELLKQGADSRMLVIERGDYMEPGIIQAPPRIVRFCRFMQHLEAALLRNGSNIALMPRSLNLFNTGIGRMVTELAPDIIHLHWINGAMLGIPELAQLPGPLVWTLHDGWAYCGTEHHHRSGDCGYRDGYGAEQDRLDRWNWRRKRNAWKSWRFRTVGPSSWITGEAAESILLKHTAPLRIFNGVDLSLFSPGDRMEARRALGIGAQERIIMFGAASLCDRNKGGAELLQALEILKKRGITGVRLLLAGAEDGKDLWPFPVVRCGLVREERELARWYRAADLFVLASKLDNLPNMLLEAGACGTPLVAFRTGGIPDIIRPGVNGFLAEPFLPESLADSMEYVWNFPAGELRGGARSVAVKHFDICRCAEQYLVLYGEMLKKSVSRDF